MDVTIHSLVLEPAEDDGPFTVVASIFPWPLRSDFGTAKTRRAVAPDARGARVLSCKLAQRAMWEALADGCDIRHFDCPHCPTPSNPACGKRREREEDDR